MPDVIRCSSCGAELTESSAEGTCPGCGRSIPPTGDDQGWELVGDAASEPRQGPQRPPSPDVVDRIRGVAWDYWLWGSVTTALSIVALVMNGGLFATKPLDDSGQVYELAGFLSFAVCSIGTGLLMVAASRRMRRLEGYRLAVATAVVMMLPLNGLCFVNMLLGTWSFLVLRRPSTRAGFRT